MAKRKGFIARFIEGPERSETYARSTLPKNRWELGWDTFKTNRGKIFGLNLLTLLFAIPLIALFIFRYAMKTYFISTLPFAQNTGIGYPVYPAAAGLEAGLTRTLNTWVFMLLPIAIAVLAVGLAGGFYVMRNMVWAEGVMVGSDFWRGVKKNYWVVFFSLLFYGVILAATVFSINSVDIILAAGQGIRWLLVLSNVVSYILIALATIMVAYMITLGVNYKLKFRHLIRNSFIFAVGLLPNNLFFMALAAVWALLALTGVSLIVVIVVMVGIIWGLSITMLIWTDYTQWVFDKFINDKVPGAKKDRGIYKPGKEPSEEMEVLEKSRLTSRPVKPITDYDVEIYELPTSFSRKDLERLEETKEAMRKDSDKYAEEHKDDYIEAEKNIAELMAEPDGADNADKNDENDKEG